MESVEGTLSGLCTSPYLRRRTADPSQHSPIHLRCHRQIVRSEQDADTPCFLQARFSTRPSWPPRRCSRRRRRGRRTNVHEAVRLSLFPQQGSGRGSARGEGQGREGATGEEIEKGGGIGFGKGRGGTADGVEPG